MAEKPILFNTDHDLKNEDGNSVDCNECKHIDCDEDCDNSKSYFYGDWGRW
jgi:hypothetical protein